VNNSLPSVTVIIAARPGQAEIESAAAARRLDYPAELLEIIVARGKQPSVQRNTALRAAHGGLVYFLDDDSVPPSSNLHRVAGHFSDSQVQMIGGPNLCPPDAPPLEKVFALVLGSWIAFGPSRARYAPVGKLRDTGEKELILCNLLARRETLLKLGGFNERLYPNEENALMDDIQKRGGRLLYDPEFIVHRHPRPTLKSFTKMLTTYGRGRAEQFRLNPTLGSVLNFVPPFFCVYLLALVVLEFLPLENSFAPIKLLAAIPLIVYLLAVVMQTLALVPAGGFIRSLLAMPLLVASHIFYGLGFWRGLFTKLSRAEDKSPVGVVLEIIRP
jgi:cellulose synthase/poly-beta-1,6-N-acetylglucosamine synthase-like glycosyltransferase